MPIHFGPYRTVAILGQGGTAIVYAAERDDGRFSQRVAIKVLRAHADARALWSERDILAALNHRAIVKLLDSGVTDDDFPSLVLEHVEGRPIDEYCAALKLSVRERLQLFLIVLDAVQHAHSKLIIHRDLKPANILVTADGRPKLLDFGADAHALTPEYASPEQLRHETLTTASDVYSLGAVLSALLTAQDEVHADLEAIVLKALRTEPAERYASVHAFAQDVNAFLTGSVVQAYRGSGWYHARTFVRQHKVRALAAVVLLAGLLAGTGTALWQASMAGNERDRARFALRQATETIAQTEAVGEFLKELFHAPPAASAHTLTADELLRRGVQRAHTLATQPVLQARMFDVIGQMHHRLGRYAEADSLLTRGYDLRRAALGAAHPDVAESLIHLARLRRSLSQRVEARRLTEAALRIRRAALAPNDLRIAEALSELSWYLYVVEQEQTLRAALAIYNTSEIDVTYPLSIMRSLSSNLRHQGRLAEAVAMDRDALALARRRLGPDAAATGYAMVHLADLVRDLERDDVEAERLYREGLAIQARQEGDNSISLAHGLHSLAVLLDRRGEHTDAEQLLRRLHAIRLAVSGPRHPSVARATALLARNAARQGRRAEAHALAHDMLRIFEISVGRAHMAYGDGLNEVAAVHALLGEWDAAVAAQRMAVAHAGMSRRSVSQLGTSHRQLGRYLMHARRFDDAERELLLSLSLVRRAYPNEGYPNVHESKRALFELYSVWQRPNDAERYRVAQVALMEEDW